MEPSEKEMLRRLTEMKKELNVKQRKLDKSKRATNVKDHVRQKIQEHNFINCSSPVKLLVASNSDKPAFGHCELTVLDCAHKHEVCDLCHTNVSVSSVKATTSSSDDNPLHPVLTAPLSSLDAGIPETKTERASHNLKEVNRFLQDQENSLKAKLHLKQCVGKKTKTEIRNSSDRKQLYDSRNSNSSPTLRSRTGNVILKRSRQESMCNDDFVQCGKARKLSRPGNKSRVSSLQADKCNIVCSSKYSHSPTKDYSSMTTVHKSPTKNTQGVVQSCHGKYSTKQTFSAHQEYTNNHENFSLVQDVHSLNKDAPEIGTKFNDFVPNKCAGPDDLKNQVPQKVFIDETIQPCQGSCHSRIANKKLCVQAMGICMDNNIVGFETEHRVNNQHFVGNCALCCSAQTQRESQTNTNLCVAHTGADSTTDDPDIESNDYGAPPHIIVGTGNKQVCLDSVNITDSSGAHKDHSNNEKRRKESSLSNESDDDIIKGSQNSIGRPVPCGRRQSLYLNGEHAVSTVSLTPSFGSSCNPLSSKSSVGISQTSDHLTDKQEPVTDSEFFNILGLTQSDKGVLSPRETHSADVPSAKEQQSNTPLSINQPGSNGCAGTLPDDSQQHVSDTAYASSHFIVKSLSCDSQLDDLSTQMSRSKKDKLGNLFNAEMPDKLDSRLTAIENPFLEYTELDVIPYSQFELSEDFLSETQQSRESMSKGCHRSKHAGALVKRRSSRISSFCFSHSNCVSPCGSLCPSQLGSQLADSACTTASFNHKQRISHTQQRRTASILSALQFLKDEAKKTSSFLEFELPILFNNLKARKIESVLQRPYCCEAHVNVENNIESVDVEEQCETINNNSLNSDYFSNNSQVRRLSCVNKKKQNLITSHDAFDEASKNDVQDLYADGVECSKYCLDTTRDSSDREHRTGMLALDQQTDMSVGNQQTDKLARDHQTGKSVGDQQTDISVGDHQTDKSAGDQQADKSAGDQQADKSAGDQQADKSAGDQQTDKSAGDQQINNVVCENEKVASTDKVQGHAWGTCHTNSNLISYNITEVKSAGCVQTNRHLHVLGHCTTPSRQKSRPISKLGRRLANPSIAKKLFVAKKASINTGFYGPNHQSGEAVGLSADTQVLQSNTNETFHRQMLLDAEASVVFSSQESSINSCPGEMLSLPETKTLSPRPENSLLCETPRKPTNSHIHSPSDSFTAAFVSPEQVLHPVTSRIPLLSTPINIFNVEQTFSPTVEFASPELISSLLESSPHQVTPNTVSSNQLSCLNKSKGGFSFTSTPKLTASYKSMGASLKPHVQVKIDRSELQNDSSQSTTDNTSKPSSPHSSITWKDHMLSGDDSYLSPAHSSITWKDHMLSGDDSYLSPAQIPVDGQDLYTDVSLISTPAEPSTISMDKTSCLSNTSSNIITPWKQLAKTASTPVIVLEKEDHRSYLGIPVFSPVVRRSRSTSASISRSTRNLTWRFAGCFQCCAQDAVVSLLSGMFRTPDNKEKYYIVSVQATSLTVWTEDDVAGWAAELDWRLSPDIHVMKACLLPRADTVIAVVASGRDKQDLFATLFVYDWSTENTSRFNIPVLEHELKSPTQIELCPFLPSELHIAVTSDTHHTVGRVIFTHQVMGVQSSSMFGVHRGKLIGFVTLNGQVSANASLTQDQEVAIWSMKLGVVLRKVKLQSSLPCLTGLLAATSSKGFLLLDTTWRLDDGHCGGVIAINPLTGRAQKVIQFSVPNNTWRSVESAKIEQNIVTAISDKGSLGIWDKHSGLLLGYTKSKITTCACLMVRTKHLVVGEIYGCLHIYTSPN